MILADTSVWIDFLGRGDERLGTLLGAKRVRMHPYVLAELSLGNLPRRPMLLAGLAQLLEADVVGHGEVASLIEQRQLFGSGIGYVDAHLLASALLAEDLQLYTRDRRLLAAAIRLDVAAAFDS